MKLLGTIIIAFLLFGFINQEEVKSDKNTQVSIISSYYKFDNISTTIEFSRIVQTASDYYNIEGKISFDPEGNTIQKMTKKDVIKKDDIPTIESKLEEKNFKQNIVNSPVVLFIQIQAKNNNELNISDLENSISETFDEQFTSKNLGTSYGTALGDGVINLELEVTDLNKALNLTLNILENKNLLDISLVGERVYIEEEDWNYEIFYPIDFDGSFYPY